MKIKSTAAIIAAIAVSATLSGCAAANPQSAEISEGEAGEETESLEEDAGFPAITVPEPIAKPETNSVPYISVTADGVNIRSGAGTAYSPVGTAEKSTLYACLGEENGWYETRYRNKTAYVYGKYCVVTEMAKSDDERIEAVVAEGTDCLGAPYVYGAVRLHDGKGNLLKGFTTDAFDCSSLMQYVFYKGADKLLDVTTRTQIYQGAEVSESDLKRGDLIFFTNSSRMNNTGIERVGHVALYLGDGYILHTSSDYAKIEKISASRWEYYVQSRRMI